MKRTLFTVTVISMVAILTVTARQMYLKEKPGPSVHTARGYRDSVDLFINANWLGYDAATRTIRPNFPSDSAMARFYRDSFLQDDVEAFNAGDVSAFRVDNAQIIAVDATRHNVVLPFSAKERWRGSLYYRPTTDLATHLTGLQTDIELQSLTKGVGLHYQPAQAVLPAIGTRSATRTAAAGEVVNLFGAPNHYFGKAYMAAESVIINQRANGIDSRITISGERIPVGNRARIMPGDILKLEWRVPNEPRYRYALLWQASTGRASVLSSLRAINGGWQRTPKTPNPPFAADLVQSIDSAVGAEEGPLAARRNSSKFDVVLTLDRDLQENVQSRLETFCRARQSQRPPFRAAVTVMDTLTGDVLALASYPTKDDLQSPSIAPGAKTRLLRNHNLSRLPIGSVAKVIFASAILQADPSLAGFTMPDTGATSINSILGIAVKPPISDHAKSGGDDGVIDFRDFIEHSSNNYAVTLLTMACTIDPNRGRARQFRGPLLATPLQLNGVPINRAPLYDPKTSDISLPLSSPARNGLSTCRTINTLELESWAKEITSLFDVDVSSHRSSTERPPGTGDDLVDTRVWMPVLEELYGDRTPRDHTFFGVAPERENLALNLVQYYRGQFLSMILGGASSTWTNPKLCEIFSRLVTGKQVSTRLVAAVTDSLEEPLPPHRRLAALPMNDDVRAALLDGMARVAGPNGTAKGLFKQLHELNKMLAARKPNEVLAFFSKTGSPRNELIAPTALTNAVNRLIAAKALKLDASGQIVYRGTLVTDEIPEAAAEPAALTALRANVADRAVIRAAGTTPEWIIRACNQYNEALPEDRSGLFKTDRGLLVRMHGGTAVKATGATYVFTAAVYDASAIQVPGTPTSLPLVDAVRFSPKRAVTVAINIEAQGNSVQVAVPFTKTILKDVVEKHLID